MNVSGSPELVAGATVCCDHIQLDTTVRNPRRSRRHQPRRNLSPDEAARASRIFASAPANTRAAAVCRSHRAFRPRAAVSDLRSLEPPCSATVSPPSGSRRRTFAAAGNFPETFALAAMFVEICGGTETHRDCLMLELDSEKLCCCWKEVEFRGDNKLRCDDVAQLSDDQPRHFYGRRVDRELLGTPATAIQADITVSKDGNGMVKTIAETIKKAPEQSRRRFVIDVKAGRYEEENLKVGQKKNKLNVHRTRQGTRSELRREENKGGEEEKEHSSEIELRPCGEELSFLRKLQMQQLKSGRFNWSVAAISRERGRFIYTALRRRQRLPALVTRRRLPNPAESTRFGVYLSIWSSYIPRLLVAKVRATPLHPELVYEVPATQMVFVRGYKDVCTIDAAGGCAGVQGQTILATQRLGLRSCSAMNSGSGLRFSIPYLAGQFPCCSPLLLSLFQLRPTSRSDYPTVSVSERGSVPAPTRDGDFGDLTARVTREAEDGHVQPAVPQQATPPIDQDALRQMVQDAARQAAQEAVQQAAHQAARVAAQEIARQMAAVQQGQQIPHGPQVQVQQGPQIHMQQAPPVQGQHDHQVPHQQAPAQQYPQVPVQPVPGVFQVPPSPPVFPVQVP
ncbi:hypothetical protein DY000_02030290 [Brassica cretica]|uniref:Pectinesterase catalytic domain-containing protein n=1 Tax=Brassica cretica TaxID=69181 RepID=A0ABQ7DFR5_BRACR|nr:hypothetical protein DY000_02030290 [Brassica cretica]